MWKYIVIVALVLFAAAAFVFYKTHSGIVSSSGEVAALKANAEAAVGKNKEIFVDEGIAAYAKMRHDWLTERKSEADAQKAKFEEENISVKQEVATLTQKYETEIGLAENQKKELEKMVEGISSRDDMKELMSKVEVDAEDMEASDPELFDKISANLKALDEKKAEMESRLSVETSTVESLVARRDSLNSQIADADALARERRARISPVELECFISTADSNWDYVIVDKGLDGGIIIGSRLAVMRGDKKICELIVTLVEANRASGDIVHSTLVTGEEVRVGDRVVSVRPSDAPQK